MATRRLRTFRTNPDHRYDVVLGGQTYIIEWRYNARADRWTTNWYDVTNTPIRHGVRLVVLNDILRRVALATKPTGSVDVLDTTGVGTEPDADTLGEQVQVRHVEA